MTTLSDLIGPNAGPVPAEVGYWHHVTRWVMGGNDQPNVGDCALVGAANLLVLVTSVVGDPQEMSDGEVENAYSRIAHWSPLRPETNRGARLTDVLEYWTENGWPSDPELKPIGWCQIGAYQIHRAVWSLGAVYAWVMLPAGGPDGWDFTDASALAGRDGTGAHAVLIVGSDADSLWIVTWAAVVKVSRAWWGSYGRDCYAVRLPGWIVPSLVE